MNGECGFRCITAADVGLPEYEPAVAYADPDCPAHGSHGREAGE